MQPRILLSCLVLAAAAMAQSPTASVVGRITDPSGAAVPEAGISVRNLDTNAVRAGRSSESGNYVITSLPPGRYELEARRDGFSAVRQGPFELQIDQAARFDIEMPVGVVSTTVMVSAAAPAINTDNGVRGDVTTSREINDLPLLGRSFANLAYLTPGVVPGADGGLGSPFNVNGGRGDDVGFLVDGFNNREGRMGGAVASPPLDGIQEFKLLTNGYSAEYGRFAGGVMSVVLKGGGNQFHGAAYEFARNDMMDARNFFAASKPKLRRHQFGTALSGPVLLPRVYDGRNKTFFVFTWESTHEIGGVASRGVVPSQAQREGDFSKVLDAAGKPVTVKDPSTNAAFPGNRIPLTRFNAVAGKALAYYPLPNAPGATNFLSQANATFRQENYSVKVDRQISGRDSLNARWVFAPTRQLNPQYAPSIIDTFGARTVQGNTILGFTFLHTASPTLLNETRAGFSRLSSNRDVADKQDYAGQLGLRGVMSNPNAWAFPYFDIRGYTLLGNNTNTQRAWFLNTYQFGNTLTKVTSRHEIKIGAEFFRNQSFTLGRTTAAGNFTFLGRFTNETFADFLLGIVQTASRQIDSERTYLFANNYAGFVQDNFKVTPSLTLNLGLRYDLMTPPAEKYGYWSNFVPELGKLVMSDDKAVPAFADRIKSTGLAQHVALARDAGLPRSLIRTNYGLVAPRFGFAWRPFANTRSVVRGGYGIFFGSNSTGFLEILGQNFPFVVAETYNGTAGNVTLSNPFPVELARAGGVSNPYGQQSSPPAMYLQSWNLTVERQVARGTALEVAYAGSKGTNLGRRWDLNQSDRSLPKVNNAFPRPFPAFGSITYVGFNSNSIYNSGTVTLRRNVEKSIFLRASYVYGKAIDTTSQYAGTSTGGFGGAQDSRNLKAERGRSDFDIGHQFVGSFVWKAPGGANRVLRAWQLSGTGRLYTGQPFTPKVATYNYDQGEASRPDRIAKGTAANPTPDRWFDPSAFLRVPLNAFRFGNSGRNILDGPGQVFLDLGLSRRFRLSDRGTLQFRWEAFNALNRTNLFLPAASVDARGAGAITRAKPARVQQLALRLEF